ncbi:MAG: aminomethyl-transferring glycine dehydrogenase subunit GcvPA [Desulfovibrionaceae bacterium]
MPFVPHTPDDTRQMLDVIGVKTLDDLFADITPDLRPRSFNIPAGKSEMDVCAFMEKLAAKNAPHLVHFLGAGFYNHYIPKAVDALVSRSEFYTAYTPYQPESSQGTLQAIFEYQSAIARLFDMECANASVYDGGSAMFEALMMAVRYTKRKVLVVDESVNPIWRRMIATYTGNVDVDIRTIAHKGGRADMAALKAAIDSSCAAVLVQNPNFFGAIEDYTDLFAHARAQKTLGVLSVYPVMQAVLKTAGEMGADVAVADGQALGMPLSFGGPYLGIMSCRKEFIRQFPGRIVGRTTDVDGKTGYVLTLQAREQHIRRAKATSNICSNQALCALRSLIYMSLLGPQGLTRVAEQSMLMARKAVAGLTALKGVSLLHDAPYGNEVAITLPCAAAPLVDKVSAQGLVPGFPVSKYYPDLDNVLLVACTEQTQPQHIAALVTLVGGAL